MVAKTTYEGTIATSDSGSMITSTVEGPTIVKNTMATINSSLVVPVSLENKDTISAARGGMACYKMCLTYGLTVECLP